MPHCRFRDFVSEPVRHTNEEAFGYVLAMTSLISTQEILVSYISSTTWTGREVQWMFKIVQSFVTFGMEVSIFTRGEALVLPRSRLDSQPFANSGSVGFSIVPQPPTATLKMQWHLREISGHGLPHSSSMSHPFETARAHHL